MSGVIQTTDSFIDGIYNYCDRWCEKCGFTSRCRNYESTGMLTEEEQDPENDAFWKKVGSNLESAISMIKEMAADRGIDLDAIPEVEVNAMQEKRKEIKNKVKNYEMIKLCEKYWQTCKDYFDEPANQTKDAKELAKKVYLGLTSQENGLKIATEISENVEIIEWYMFFIDAKLQRALDGKFDAADESEEKYKSDLYDANGSAKIALIAIDKSMSAWKKLYELRETAEDVGLQCLSILSTIKKKVLEEFPKAMEFIRPGFDDRTT